MELKEFISCTLTQILEGVKEAQEIAIESTAYINPSGHQPRVIANQILFELQTGRTNTKYGQNIEFDIAITETEGDKAQGSIGVVASVIGVGLKGEVEETSSAINRVKFSIPVFLPQQ